MSRKDDVKFVRDVTQDDVELKARQPFDVKTENRRRFIRLEIDSPMTLQKIKESGGEFLSEVDWHIINGSILNISVGGVLVDADQALFEGDVVSMGFTLQKAEQLDSVLGLVKRVDADEGSFLAGIEFVSREKLRDLFSSGELEMLPENMTDFNQGVRTVLEKYVYQEASGDRS